MQAAIDKMMNLPPMTGEELVALQAKLRATVEAGIRRGLHPLAGAEPLTLHLLATALHLQAEIDELRRIL
jgi:hypothetical protein